MKTLAQAEAEMRLLIGRRMWLHDSLSGLRYSAPILDAEAFNGVSFGGASILVRSPITGDQIWIRYDEKTTRILSPLEELAECAE